MAAALRGRLLGRFELFVEGRAVDRSAFERPSGARLLKLLLATPGHRVRREVAAELLWPEMEPDRSAANLRKAIHFARRALDDEASERDSVIRGDAEWLRLDESAGLELDLDVLREALDGGRGSGASPEAGDWAALETIADLGGAELLPEDPYGAPDLSEGRPAS